MSTGVALLLLLLAWAGAWWLNIRAVRAGGWLGRIFPPVFFGATLLLLWELAVRVFHVSPVLLPAPSAIAVRLVASGAVLWGDVVQTFFKGALSGYVIGCGAAIVAGILVDRMPFLRRGLLPVGILICASRGEPPSPAKPATPVPTTVETILSGEMRRTRWLR